MFIFWVVIISVISAGYVTRQNRIATEAMQQKFDKTLVEMSASQKDKTKPANKSATTAPAPTTVIPPKLTLTIDVVATHSTVSDCWVILSGKVYSVAPYIPMHPGGSKRIINVCGGDITEIFNSTKGGHRHSSFAQSLLGQYLVGDLQ